MKVLVCIPHFYNKSVAQHDIEGSSQDEIGRRTEILLLCLQQWLTLISPDRFFIGSDQSISLVANNVARRSASGIDGDVYLCVSKEDHLLSDLSSLSFKYAKSNILNPRLLPFMCRRVFSDFKNEYDLFVYSEDDTAPLDPLFLKKVANFYKEQGEEYLLLPNRYELFSKERVKVYLDEPSPDAFRFEKHLMFPDQILVNSKSDEIELRQTTSPFSGMFAITRQQLFAWMCQSDFFKPIPSSPMNSLEQAMVPMFGKRPVFKPTFRNADYLEVHHVPNRASRAQTPYQLIRTLKNRNSTPKHGTE